MIKPEQLMRLAIEKAREGIPAGQSPFGCAMARDGALLAAEHNTVWSTTDITAHAEINAIRAACGKLGEIFLEGAVVATTCEPCPMCMAALHWSRVAKVYYGATVSDAQAVGFNELQVPAAAIVRMGGSRVKLVAGLLDRECRQLFQDWAAMDQHRAY